jgi:hypothetical protein
MKKDCKKCAYVDLKNEFYKKVWSKFGDRISKNYKTHLKYEIFTTENPEEIKYIMTTLNKGDMQATKFNGKFYQIFYTFGYDVTPFYFDYKKQFSCM